MMDTTTAHPTFWLAALIVFGAMVVRAITGFGAALVLVPLLGLFWNLRQVVLVAAIVQVATGLPLTMVARRDVTRRVLAVLLVGSLAGLPLGSLLLSALPLTALRRGLGALTLALGLSWLLPLRRRVARKPSRARLAVALGVVTGWVSGLLAGAIGTGGPPVVGYLQYRLPDPTARRATLLAYFMVIDIVRLVGYLQLGIGGPTTLRTAAALAPFALLGSVVGSHIHGRAGARVVALCVACLLVVTGALLLR